jgi:hypothetical protein
MSPVISETVEGKSVSDLDIQEWIHDRYGFVPHPFWISHCRDLYLSADGGQTRGPRYECPPDKRSAIREAFYYFGILGA